MNSVNKTKRGQAPFNDEKAKRGLAPFAVIMFDSILLIGFGAPEREEDIVPFLTGILDGHAISPQRFDQVLANYRLLGNRSPYNELARRQAQALKSWLTGHKISLPVFLGMRNWHPYLKETLHQMKERNCERTFGIVLAPHRSPASFDRYLAGVEAAKAAAGYEKLKVDYAPAWHLHPLFIEALSERVRQVLNKIDFEKSKIIEFVFTAHSLPLSMARQSNYEGDIRDTARAVMENFYGFHWHVAYQSRSGKPDDLWLGPDINLLIGERAKAGVNCLVVIPAGFLCDHVEVLYDLDVLAKETASRHKIQLERALTVMDHPKFIEMLGSVILSGPKGPLRGAKDLAL